MSAEDLDRHKLECRDNELWAMSFDGAITQVARGRKSSIYQAGLSDTQKNNFKNSIIDWVAGKNGIISSYNDKTMSQIIFIPKF